jgi:hypothetical protein
MPLCGGKGHHRISRTQLALRGMHRRQALCHEPHLGTHGDSLRPIPPSLGVPRHELDKPSVLDGMERVGREALVEAYQRHELTRNTRSLLFCVLVLLDALDQGDSLKTLGLHVKMTHDDPGLYLISHASLAKRGLSIGQAGVYHMLSPEHRLYLPFSLLQLLVDMNGRDLPRMPYTRPPTLQEIVDHLNALTADFLQLALAHTILNDDGWQGLGLLSGSRLSDLILKLIVFNTRYEEGQ